MAFDLASIRDHVLSNVLLDVGLHAELLTVTDPDGTSRTITAKVSSPEIVYEVANENETAVERLPVLCKRDEDDADHGGIETAAAGLSVSRAASIDPDTRPFMFTGEIENIRPNAWRLIFARTVQKAIGARE